MNVLPLLLLATAVRAEPRLLHPEVRFDRAPEAALADCRAAKDRAQKAFDAVAAVPAGERRFANTALAFDRAEAELAEDTESIQFLKSVAISSAARAAGAQCEVLIDQFVVDVYAREDLYRALSDAAAAKEPLSAADARLLEKILLEYRRSGLQLPAEKRERLSGLRKKLAAASSAFGQNLNEARAWGVFGRERLTGLSDDYVSRLPRDGERYKVGVEYPSYFPFMENARDASARREMEALFADRAAAKNMAVLDEMLSLRDQSALLLGYRSHAHYAAEPRMAKTPETVQAFIARMRRRLEPLAREELTVLRALKRVMEGPSSDGVIHVWDWRFYDNQLKKLQYEVDQEKIREYFPADLVVEQTMAIYETLLGLKFRPVPGAPVWHPEARAYAVFDASGGEPLAYFYMDLYPREGKYSHAAAFSLIRGRALPDGGYAKPVSAMVSNFDKPSAERPSLLKHDEVRTFFHEFGHIMHQTLTKARHHRFAGSSVARDFVEAPSMMLENWIWEPAVLARLSGHYKDRSRKLPPELLAKLVAARNAGIGLYLLRQFFFAALDQAYHDGRPPRDTTADWARLMPEVALIPMSPGTRPQTSLGHLAGYDGVLYAYMWAQVYAQDMYTVFKKGGFMNPELGRRYRAEVLERGSEREELDSLKAFLGREPNEDAFLENVGLKPR